MNDQSADRGRMTRARDAIAGGAGVVVRVALIAVAILLASGVLRRLAGKEVPVVADGWTGLVVGVLLVVAAILTVAAPRDLPRTAVELSAATALFLAVAWLVGLVAAAPAVPGPPTASFAVSGRIVKLASPALADAAVATSGTALIVTGVRDADGRTMFETVAVEVVWSRPAPGRDFILTVERGEGDAQAAKVAAALESAVRVWILDGNP